MKKILVVDNYDSFVFNLVQILRESNRCNVTIRRNTQIDIDEVSQFDGILLSPGPGVPQEAGIMPEIVKKYADSKSILGVCLGHQCIGEVFGGTLENLKDVIHGKATKILVKDSTNPLYKNLNQVFDAGRYHSWVIAKKDLPDCFIVTAEDEQGYIMSISHKTFPVHGVQFHPESVMTKSGVDLLHNWLDLV